MQADHTNLDVSIGAVIVCGVFCGVACDECDCEGDCDECECGCDCEETYEIECPKCGDVICFDESVDPEALKCPACGAKVALTREEWYEIYKAAGNVLP